MNIGLSAQQEQAQAEFRAFVDREIVPAANDWHYQQRTPPEMIAQLAARGYLGLALSPDFGGGGRDMVTLGLLMEEVGRGCSSLRSLLTVHSMVAHVIARWGTRRQKEQWLPRLASGKTIAAFALSEPGAGSDAKSIAATATPTADGFALNGEKKWITYGQTAELFLVFAQCEGQPAAFLVERSTAGLSVEPILELLGLRASMTGRVLLADCRIPKENLLGRIGFGVSHVAGLALDLGRSHVAWGCVGIAQACTDASILYTQSRSQFGALLKDHQLVRQMVSDMLTNAAAARLMCLNASRLRDALDPQAVAATAMAKYFASRAAVEAAVNTVQIHGANGCSREYSAARYLCDAKIMEIIEGSNQIQQLTIAEYGYQEYGALQHRARSRSAAAKE